MITNQELEEMEKRAEAATPGPWTFEDERYSAKCVVGLKPRDDRWVAHFQPELNGQNNGRFSAHARTDMPRLIAEVKRLQKELDDLVNYRARCCFEAEKERDRFREALVVAERALEKADDLYRAGCGAGHPMGSYLDEHEGKQIIWEMDHALEAIHKARGQS